MVLAVDNLNRSENIMVTIDDAIEELQRLRVLLGGSSTLYTTRDGESLRHIQIGTMKIRREIVSVKLSKIGTPVAMVVLAKR